MKVDEVFWRGQARVLRETAEAWKEQHDEAAFLLDCEELMGQVLNSHEQFRALVRRVWDGLFSGTLQQVTPVGELMQGLCEETAESVQALLSIARNYQGAGYRVEKAEGLEKALADYRRWETDFKNRWPRFDPAGLEEGLAQASRGEFVDFEEICREFPELRDAPHP